jgi:hypothetical protein
VNKQVGIIAGAALVVILLAAGIAVAVSGGGDDDKASVTSQTSSTSTSTTEAAQQGGGGQSGGGGGQSGGGGGQSGGGNASPEIKDLQPFAEFGGDNCDQKPFLDLQGHAFDEDGPNDQQAAKVEINWGDNNSTTITTFANGAFVGSQHCYDSSYGGQTVNVSVTAFDDQGATDSQSVSVPLPAS